MEQEEYIKHITLVGGESTMKKNIKIPSIYMKCPVEEKTEWLHSCIWTFGCTLSTKTFELAVTDLAQGAETGQLSPAGSLPWFSVEWVHFQTGFCLFAVSFFLMSKLTLAKPAQMFLLRTVLHLQEKSGCFPHVRSIPL